ncbi:MAG: protein translocase SEC61 complex subunit gamma [Candidatus Aenigmatarchaeota archaeon]
MKIKLNLNIKERLQQYKRILILARKPTKGEIKRVSKICLISFLIMGSISFIFYLISVVFGA